MTMADPGKAGPKSPSPPPLFLDQTEAQRAEKDFLRPLSLISGSEWPPPPLSAGPDPPLYDNVSELYR